MKIKKIISVTLSFFTLLSLIPSFSVQAESDEYESDMELIQKAYDLYAMMYEAYEIPEFTDPDEHPITDEYTEKASETYGIYFKRFSNGVLTKEDFVEYVSSYFTPDIANRIAKETRWFKIIDGNVVMHFDGTMGWLFTRCRTEKERIIERTADTVTYEVFFYVHNTSGNGPEESRTFIIKHGENGSRIIGGTFIEEAFQIEIENPQTSDAPIIAVCVLVASAAAAAVVILKKKKVM
jgi:hypothetical protein